MGERTYLAIDLKSFYASVECVERGLDPMATHLVVADEARTDKTICLAVSPALKAYGVPGRARLFEARQAVEKANRRRRARAPGGVFTGRSWDERALAADPGLEMDILVAPPRMAHYIEMSARVYQVYLRFAAPDDIHVYSIDEVFIDATDYLKSAGVTAEAFAREAVRQVLAATGITATAGIGPNLYLAKVAMDIEAKHCPPDENGARVARLDEGSFRQKYWDHRPLTDFWRVGRGIARRLEENGLATLGDVARLSLSDAGQEKLFRLFGVNAELLIDHAWGFESCTMADIKAYKPADHSLGSGQVLQEPYPFAKAALAVREMADALALDLVAQGLVTDRLTLAVGYDIENLTDPARKAAYHGPVVTDHYGRRVPKPAHGTAKLETPTASARELVAAAGALMDKIADPALLVRRLTLTAGRVLPEAEAEAAVVCRQLDLFHDWQAEAARQKEAAARRAREKKMQQAMLGIKQKYGKNAILKGMDLEEGATGKLRNGQIGGHKA
ncbi:DNA methylase [Candidatus Allofournierella merdavium]|uniref:Y-family DNA polymerase n=1 Tax=Candidatus Allofournierella merdavium TaxID=2838593 RepID=UPI00374FBFAF